MFRVFLITAAVVSLAAAAEAAVSASWLQNRIEAGETVTLRIRGDFSGEPVLMWRQPDSMRQAGVRNSRRIVNGSVSSEYFRDFAVSAVPGGRLEIPALTVKAGGESCAVPAHSVEVVPPEVLITGRNTDEAPKLDDMIFGRGRVFPEGESYLGVTGMLVLELYISDRLRTAVKTAPEAEIDKAIRPAFPSGEEMIYSGGRPCTVDGEAFTRHTFVTLFRPLATGILEPRADVRVELATSSRRYVSRQVDFRIPAITVLPMPPVPENVIYTGVAGDFDIRCRITGDNRRTGEALTLTAALEPATPGIAAEAALETLKAPEFQWPGCRVFPPEINRTGDGGAVINYVFIPLTPGELTTPCRFAVFDPVSGDYRVAGVDSEIVIEPGDGPVRAEESPVQAPAAEPGGGPQDNPASGFWLREPDFGESSPGFIRAAAWCFGPLAAAVMVLVALLRRRERGGRMRREALRRLKSAAGRISERNTGDFAVLMDGEILPGLRAVYGLASGSSIEEIADRAAKDSHELRDALMDYSAAAYTPGRDIGGTAAAIGRCIKALFVAALLLFIPAAATADPGGELYNEAAELCGAGDWTEGSRRFETMLHTSPGDAALWYDLGVCAAAREDWGEALWRFEGSLQLAPWDAETLSAVNAVRRKLLLPEIGRARNPAELLRCCRDFMRPRDWMMLAGICWSLLWIWFGAGIFGKRGANLLWTVGGVLFLGMAICIAAGYSQRFGVFAPDRGIILRKTALLSLPGGLNSEHSGDVAAGTEVRVLASRNGYRRVAAGDSLHGWASEADLGLLPCTAER